MLRGLQGRQGQLADRRVDLQRNSFGHGWQKGLRNAPTMLNAVVNIAQFWDGRAKDLREQVTDNRPSSRL